MKNAVVKPRTVSFEDALRNLASKLTGKATNELPRTQEGIVQFMAENVPSAAEMAEAITQEVLARLSAMAPAEPDASEVQTTPDDEQGDEQGAQTDANGSVEPSDGVSGTETSPNPTAAPDDEQGAQSADETPPAPGDEPPKAGKPKSGKKSRTNTNE